MSFKMLLDIGNCNFCKSKAEMIYIEKGFFRFRIITLCKECEIQRRKKNSIIEQYFAKKKKYLMKNTKDIEDDLDVSKEINLLNDLLKREGFLIEERRKTIKEFTNIINKLVLQAK